MSRTRRIASQEKAKTDKMALYGLFIRPEEKPGEGQLRNPTPEQRIFTAGPALFSDLQKASNQGAAKRRREIPG
jgi:hypothetical protein